MVPLKKLFDALTKISLNREYLKALFNLYVNSQSVVKVGNFISSFFSATKGLRQGCNLSPILFKIYIREALNDWNRKIAGWEYK